MEVEAAEALFTGADGDYRFARWGRPIVPVVFGVDDATLPIVKGAIEAVVATAGHKMAETDPELGANLMLFFLAEWDELLPVPRLEEMLPDLPSLVARLNAAGAYQYRTFRSDEDGAIKACFAFVRLAGDMAAQPAEAVALGQAVGAMLTWAGDAFRARPILAADPETGRMVVRPDIAAVLRAAYDPMMPAVSQDTAHALRLAARIPAGLS